MSKALSAQTTLTLRIDPDLAKGGTTGDIFDSARFIPLETTKESLFGTVDQLEVTDSLFIILDIRGRSILIFKRDGLFKLKISTGGIDKYFGYFTYNRKSEQIIVKNNFAGGLLIYNLNGTLLGTQKCPEKIESLYQFNQQTFVYNVRRPFQPTPIVKIPYDLVYTKGFDSITKYLGSYNPRVEDGEYNIDCNPFNFSGQDGTCMFSIPFDYTVYELSDTGVVGIFKFVFPKQLSLPHNFSKDSLFYAKRAKYVYTDRENAKQIYALERVYKVKDYLLFTACNGSLRIGSDWNYLYNLKNNELISFSRVIGDTTSYYFPFLSNVFENLDAVYAGKIFTSIPSFMLYSIKNNINKSVQYPESLKKYFLRNDKNDNPVIVELQLKNNQ